MGISCLSKPCFTVARKRLGAVVHPEPKTEEISHHHSRGPGPTSTMELSVIVNHNQHSSQQMTPVIKVHGDQKVDRNLWGRRGSSMRAKSPRGPKISFRPPSIASETSSVTGLMNGFYALATMTTYELKLIPDIWKSCLEINRDYCEHVIMRLLNKHPELEFMFDEAVPRCPAGLKPPNSTMESPVLEHGDMRAIVRDKSKHLMAFFNRLITRDELDCDRSLEECYKLGRSHAKYFNDKGLQPFHWDALAYCIVQEYKKTQMNSDLNTDEKELRMLSWAHFSTAVASSIREAFEDEIHHSFDDC